MTKETLQRAGESSISVGQKLYDSPEVMLAGIRAVEAIASRHGAGPIVRKLFHLRQRVEEDRFQLAVVGQFKRGKTSVVNALLKSQVLPVGALPSTSVLTVVKYGESQAAEVVFQSGERLPVSIGELNEYVTEGGNPGNAKNVEQVEVSYPSELLRGGLTLINCPGFGSSSGRNTKTAYEFLSLVDAAIVVTSPDPPLTSAEVQFIQRTAELGKRVFLVMNKIDLFDAKFLGALLKYTQDGVADALGANVPVYAVSARDTLDRNSSRQPAGLEASGFRSLESDLQRFLKYERNDAFHASIQRTLVSFIEDLRAYLQSCIESTAASSQAFERKGVKLEEELQAALRHQERNEAALNATVSLLAGLVESDTNRFIESRLPLLRLTVDARAKECSRLSKRDMLASLERFTGDQIQRILMRHRPDFELSLGDAFRDACVKFLQATNHTAEDIRAITLETLGVHMTAFPEMELPVVPDELPKTPAIRFRLNPFCYSLPDPLFLWRLRKTALEAAPPELERAVRLIARNLKADLCALAKVFIEHARNRVNALVAEVQSALAEARANRDHPQIGDRDSLRRLSADIGELGRIEGTLN